MGVHYRVVGDHVAQSQFDRVHAERFGQFVDLHLGGKGALWPTKAAECAAGEMIGVDRIRINGDVVNLIGARDH